MGPGNREAVYIAGASSLNTPFPSAYSNASIGSGEHGRFGSCCHRGRYSGAHLLPAISRNTGAVLPCWNGARLRLKRLGSTQAASGRWAGVMFPTWSPT